MNESQLIERWLAYRRKYPKNAAALKVLLCELYGVRNDPKKFSAGLNQLQELLSDSAQKILGVNVADQQGLTAWASAMGFIGLIKKEHELTGRHV